ncbi:MAG: metal ABC transporter permease [Phycisphaerales bacterium]
MTWSHPYDTWILIIAVLCAVTCALPGCYLLLRRSSMMGDAISHAVLPGLAGGFLLTAMLQSNAWLAETFPALSARFAGVDPRHPLIMLGGAAVVGVFTALASEWLSRVGRVERSAAMGVVFSIMFALGLILIRLAADHVDLDASCVLYGAIELAPSDTWQVAGVMLPRAVIVLGASLLLNLLFVVIFYKELLISSFDPGLATAQGISAKLMNSLLMVVVAVTSVAAFETVGSILVIAMLVVPGAAAHLLTDRLRVMLLLAAVLAAVMAGLGHISAIVVPSWFGFRETVVAGAIATAAGFVFVAVMFLAPQHGLISRALRSARHRAIVLEDDLLGLLYRQVEHGVSHVERAALINRAADALATSPRTIVRRLRSMNRQGLIAIDSTADTHALVTLTQSGLARSRDLVRSHRLWESYLVDQLGLRDDHVHRTAMDLEHVTDAAMQSDLAKKVLDPQRDPHGRTIPDNL